MYGGCLCVRRGREKGEAMCVCYHYHTRGIVTGDGVPERGGAQNEPRLGVVASIHLARIICNTMTVQQRDQENV